MRTRISVIVTAALSVLILAGCGGGGHNSSNTPISTGKVAVTLRSTQATATVTTVTVTVSGPAITTPIVVALDKVDPGWSKTFDVPSGIDRTFDIVAKDSTGKTVGTGTGMSDVNVGVTTTVTLDLWIETTTGKVALKVSFNNPFLGIAPIQACLGHYTKPGQSPANNTIIPEAQVAEQIGVAAKTCNELHTFTCTNGNEFDAKYCAQNNIRLHMGVWIGPDKVANEKEIQAAIAIAKGSYKPFGFVVGSEVLLRGDQTEDDIIGYINELKAAVPGTIEITYSDTWNTWYNNGAGRPNLLAKVDYVMINCYPFWEGVSIDQAVANVANDWNKVRSVSGGKAVYIGETNWPSAGSPNGAAVPSEMNQRRFVTDITAWGRSVKDGGYTTIFFFELFNEPYKNEPYGVGPNWGLLDSNEVVKPEISKILF